MENKGKILNEITFQVLRCGNGKIKVKVLNVVDTRERRFMLKITKLLESWHRGRI